jgi:hypothetical protein
MQRPLFAQHVLISVQLRRKAEVQYIPFNMQSMYTHSET